MTPVLAIENLDVYYGRAHTLQGVSLTLERGVIAVVGRNGMGKTTLCNAITGLLFTSGSAKGSIRFMGEELLGLPANRITRLGVGFVPQGRRVWPSLTVDEHLKLAVRKGPWTVARAYATFPRLAERKGNGGAELSGGEQQMLALGRALMSKPRLLLLDEPSMGLAPLMVAKIFEVVRKIASEGVTILLVEQNARLALQAASRAYVMESGTITLAGNAKGLLADPRVREAYLGEEPA